MFSWAFRKHLYTIATDVSDILMDNFIEMRLHSQAHDESTNGRLDMLGGSNRFAVDMQSFSFDLVRSHCLSIAYAGGVLCISEGDRNDSPVQQLKSTNFLSTFAAMHRLHLTWRYFNNNTRFFPVVTKGFRHLSCA